MNFFSRFLPQRNPILLISFANLQQVQATSLMRYDTQDGSMRWVDMGLNGTVTISSTTGICGADNKVYVLAISSDVTHVFAFDQASLAPLWHQALPESHDVHSIAIEGQYAYIVSTGTDEVIRYRVMPDAFVDPHVAWTPSGAGKDTHHLNSVTSHQGEIFVTGFGPKKSERWSSADDGYIFNLTQGHYVKMGLYHPHTIVSHNGALYYCDSSRAAFASMDGPLVELKGYVRGACFSGKSVVHIGTSMGRKVSKSTGIVNNPADDGENWGFCGITRYDLRSKTTSIMDLSEYGQEIYDVYYLASH